MFGCTPNSNSNLVAGLEHIHSYNIVHRDIKMENVLMNQHYGIKLTDFGFAKKLEPGETLSDLCGTLSYIAPEMIRSAMTGEGGYGIEVDMWACGVLLYTLLMGQPPFHHPKRVCIFTSVTFEFSSFQAFFLYLSSIKTKY